MLQQRITLSLQAGLLLLTLAIIHMGGSVLGGLGIISDLFVVIGFSQTVKFFLDSYMRDEVSEAFQDFIDLESLSQEVTGVVRAAMNQDELKARVEEDPRNVFKSLSLVVPESQEREELEF